MLTLNNYKTVFYDHITISPGQTLDISYTPNVISNDNIIKIVYNEDVSKSYILKVDKPDDPHPSLKWDICGNTQLTTDFALTQDGSFFQKISPNIASNLYLKM